VLSTNPAISQLDLVSCLRTREQKWCKRKRSSQELKETYEEKSNGFYSEPSSQIPSFIFDFFPERSTPLHFWRTDRKTFFHKTSFLLLVACRVIKNVARKMRSSDKEPTTIHLYSYDHHSDRWLESYVGSFLFVILSRVSSSFIWIYYSYIIVSINKKNYFYLMRYHFQNYR